MRDLNAEFDLAVVTTSPSVIYKVVMNDGSVEMVQNPSNLPDAALIDHIEEPMVKADIMGSKRLCRQYYGVMSGQERQNAPYGIYNG